MTEDHVTFEQWDAAYVLGALAPDDRRAFEAHLATCELCRSAVADLAAMPALLTRAQPHFQAPDAVVEIAQAGPPANLLSLVEAREERRHKAARRRVAWVAVGAAALLALGIAVPVAVLRDSPAPAAVVALDQVGDTAMTASVSLESVAWGTAISMTCDYPADSSWSGPGGAYTYTLSVTDTSGNTQQVATWAAVPGKTISVEASTAVPAGDIASVEVRTSTGEVLLQSTSV